MCMKIINKIQIWNDSDQWLTKSGVNMQTFWDMDGRIGSEWPDNGRNLKLSSHMNHINNFPVWSDPDYWLTIPVSILQAFWDMDCRNGSEWSGIILSWELLKEHQKLHKMSLEKCDVTHAYRFRQLTIVGLREGSGHVDQHISRDHLKAILMEKKIFLSRWSGTIQSQGTGAWARSRSMYCTVGVEWFFRSSWSLGIGDWGSIRISDRSFAGVKLERVQISSQKFTLLLHWIGHFFWPADLSIWKLEGTTSGDIVWKSGHCWSTMLNGEKCFRAIFENCQVLNLKNLLIP
jgi:hypothetical protein